MWTFLEVGEMTVKVSPWVLIFIAIIGIGLVNVQK